MGSPALFGANNIASLLQASMAMNGGALINSNGAYNYIPTAPLQRGLTTGWSLGHVSLTSGLPTGTPTFGSGADANLLLGASLTNPLNGVYSYSYTSSAANVVGDFMATDALTVRREDVSKVLQIKFAYEAVTGTSAMNFSGTSSNSFGVAIYDVTNSAWIIPAGVFNLVQNSGVGICTATFQTPATMTSYRLVIYNVTQVAAVSNLRLGDFYVGPQVAPQGAAMSDLQSYTPTFTGFGTVSSVSVQSARIGQFLYVVGKFTAGTVAASTASMTLGFQGGNGNVTTASTVSAGTVLGKVTNSNVSSSTYFGAQTVLAVANGTTVNFGVQTSTLAAGTVANGDSVGNTGSVVSFEFMVPIQGWSSNTTMSADTDTRVVDFSGTIGSQAVTASTTNYAVTATKDSHSAWNGTQYVVPVAGDYLVTGSAWSSGSTTATYVYKNGTTTGRALCGTAGGGAANAGAALITGLVPGDLISIRNDSSVTLTTGGNLGIFRLSGPATITATESVTMRAYQSTQSLSNGATNTLIFTTKKFDSHNGYNTSTGVYTVPVSGKYQVSAYIACSGAVASAVGLRYDLGVFLNGSLNSYLNTFEYQNNSNTISGHMGGSTLISCNAGDTINLNIGKDAGIGASSVTTGEPSAWFSIERVGN